MNRINHGKQGKATKELVVGKCWEFFNDNFHKFSQANKIKIGLALCTRDMPTSPLVDQSTHNHFVIFRNPKSLQEENAISPRETVKQC